MRRFLLLLSLVLLCCFALSVMAQETTAGLDGHVKDATGAVVAKATVEVTSSALIGTKKVETDSSGYFRFVNLPVGTYTLTATANGFRTYKASGLQLSVGRFPTLEVALEVGAVAETVEVVGAAPLVDTTQSKVQTVVSEEVLNDLPKGRSFQSLIALAPGARNEPLNAGYSINGATNSENAYLIEGQETANIQTGNSDTNAPMEFIQEVQVKSSGFEAEYGGALGGVVNVVQKRGSNNWHGSILSYLSTDALNANPNPVVRRNPVGYVSGVRKDAPLEYFNFKDDQSKIIEPGYEIGGALLKDRIWVFSSFIPRIAHYTRTTNFTSSPFSIFGGTNSTIPFGARTYHYNDTTYYALNRIDAMPFSKLRVFGSWQYNYRRGQGGNINATTGGWAGGSGMPWPDTFSGTNTNPDASSNPDNFNNSIGYVRPMVMYLTGGDLNISNNVVATTRFGYVYNDYQDRGFAVGNKYWYRDTNYPYGTSIGNSDGVTALGLNGVGPTLNDVFPAAVHSNNFQSIGSNAASLYDKYSRTSFAQDLSWFTKFAGTHNFKFGYALNKLKNNANTTFSDPSQVYVAFGQAYSPGTVNNCAAIRDYNIAQGWNGLTQNEDGTTSVLPGGATVDPDTGDVTSCMGLWGTVNIREVTTQGKVSSNNHSFYLQDAWTPMSRLTINAGIRFDKESLPSYTPGYPGISFGFGDKAAPRLGASYDLLGNGKFKVYGSFGYFYDIMKYELPRGSFGGDYWHDCVYALDTPNIGQIVPTIGSDGHFCPKSGEANGVPSVPGVARLIENYDYRMPSNTPGESTIDPNLKPMKQHEMVMGFDWSVSKNLAFETRYSRKRLDRTIEDAGVLVSGGEMYYITNPGEGINATKFCDTCPANPKASRRYDGLEFRLTKRGGGNWGGSVSYTYSKLYGNYSGLTATDVSDGGAARNSPNVDRAFDEPYMQFNPQAQLIDGPLATDRPHALNGYGYYRLKWFHQETTFGMFQQVYSGTPITSYLSVWGAPVFVANRGEFVDVTTDASGNFTVGTPYARRSPMYSQSDFNIAHEIKVSKTNEAMRLGFEFNVLNLFNQHSPTFIDGNLLRTGYIHPAGGDYSVMLTSGYDWLGLVNSEKLIKNYRYGQAYGWQDPRSIRMKIKFTF